MFRDLVEALDALLKAIGVLDSPDKKRGRLAKELLHIYLAIGGIVERGRLILQFRVDPSVIEETATPLLVQQARSLEQLSSYLTSGATGSILQLHAPLLRNDLLASIHVKGRRVWFALDQLTGVPSLTASPPRGQLPITKLDEVFGLDNSRLVILGDADDIE